MKKIQDLVYRGMVLNDRGKWVPIGEKLRKEKSFLHHLEQGEILIEGKWRKLNEAPRNDAALDETRDVKHAAPLPSSAPRIEQPLPQLRETPEETVSFSTETLRDFSLASSTPPREEPRMPEESVQQEPDDDFAPETKIILIDRQRQQSASKRPSPPAPVPSGDRVHLSETVADMSIAAETKAFIVPGKPTPSEILQKRVTPETEYLETVLYNTRMLKKTENETPAAPLPESVPAKSPLSRPISFGIPDEDELLIKKRSVPFWVFMVLGVAGIAVIASLWMYM